MGYRLGSTHGTPLTEGQRDQLDRLLYLEWGVEGEVEGYGGQRGGGGPPCEDSVTKHKNICFAYYIVFLSQIDR